MLSGNPIEIEMAVFPYNYSTQKDSVYVIISVSEELARNSLTWGEIKSQKFYPNEVGLVNIDVSSIIDAYLEYFTPPANLDGLSIVPGSQSRAFKVTFSLYAGFEIQDTQTVIVPAIKAGASYQYFNADLSYPNLAEFTTQKLLMSTDGNDTVFKNSKFFIFFTTIAEIAPEIFVTYLINYVVDGIYQGNTGYIQNPGSNPTITTGGAWSMACLPGGFDQLNLQDALPPGAVAYEYYLQIHGRLNDSDSMLFPEIKFKIEQRDFLDSKQLLYRNSLGSLMPLHLLGQIDTQSDYTFQNISKLSPPSYLLDKNIIAENFQEYNEETRKFTAETGFITQYQADRLRDFFLSKQRYEVIDGQLIPIILNSKTIKFYSNKENLISVQIDWQHAFTNTFYTAPVTIPGYCPAVKVLEWQQSGNNEITVFWAFPFGHAYGRLNILFPGEDIQQFELAGNSGLTKIPFERPASAEGIEVAIIVSAMVICDRYNIDPSFGPVFELPEQYVSATILPITVDDNYDIPSGYTGAVALTPYALANDFDPSGQPIEAIPDSGSTAAGGLYQIDEIGLIHYTPPSSSFVGPDQFEYYIHIPPSGDPVHGLVTINVGSAANPIYAKIVLRNYNAGYSNGGEVWIDFFSNPAGTTPLDVTSFPFNVNFHRKVTRYTSSSPSAQDDDYAATAYGFKMLIFTGALIYTGTAVSRVTAYTLEAGIGYTAI